MDDTRALLRHVLASLAYRTQKALRDAPASFADFSAGHDARTPRQLVHHMASLMGYARTFFEGGAYRPAPVPTFDGEIARFHEQVDALGAVLDGNAQLRDISFEQLLRGPLADALTHAGQLALLRRLSGSPVPPENFIHARMSPDKLGPDQPPPARPDADWPERPK